MNKEIKKILKELYKIDSGLKAHEGELTELLSTLLTNKPNIKADPAFVKELRLKISEASKKDADFKNTINQKTNMLNIFQNFKKLSLAAGGLVLVFVFVFVFNLFGEGNKKIAFNDGAVSFQKMEDNAFGDITQNVSSEPEAQPGPHAGGGRSSESMNTDQSTTTMPVPPIYELTPIRYSYIGDDFVLNEREDVYKRVSDYSYLQKVVSNMQGLDIPNLQLNNLSNPIIRFIEISEDTPYGYNVSIRSAENSISIMANWEKWPRDDRRGCLDHKCIEPYILETEPVQKDISTPLTDANLDKDKILSIAGQFTERFGINTDAYMPGELRQTFFPAGQPVQTVPVIYPLVINDRPVYQNTGNRDGMYADVSLQHNRIVNFTNIVSNRYAVSAYKVEQNKEKILDIAQRGGAFGSLYLPRDNNTPEIVELGTPKNVLITVTRYNDDQSQEEFLVPALAFPIENKDAFPERVFAYRDANIIVPVIKGFMDMHERTIEPVPLSITEEAR